MKTSPNPYQTAAPDSSTALAATTRARNPWFSLAWKTMLFLALPAACLLFVVLRNPSTSAIGGGEAGPAGKEVSVQKLAGAPFRVVWIRDVANKGHDPFAYKGGFKLMGYDSADGRGPVDILSTPSSYRKPMLTPDGQRIVFTDFLKTEMKIVNWDGTGLRSLGRGIAMELWTDPADGVLHLYSIDDEPDVNILAAGKPLVRSPLDQPGQKKVVWDKTQITLDSFQVSADGKRAACLTPWPEASLMNLEAGTIDRVGTGCWVAMSPDNSYNMWVFDGAHKNLELRIPGERFISKVYISGAPGIDNFETYHPRWSNHPRVITMTGPYKEMGIANAIGGGGSSGVYVGRFNKEFNGIKAWARITEGEIDHFPDVWVQGGGSEGVRTAKAPPVAAGAAVVASGDWPAKNDGLQYVWKNSKHQNAIDRGADGYEKCFARLLGRARYGEFGQAILHNGGLSGLQMDEKITKAVRASDAFTLEFSCFMLERKHYAKSAVLAGQLSNLDQGNFVLLQSELYGKPQLKLKIRTTQGSLKDTTPLELFDLPVNQPVHLAISFAKGKTSVFVNGEPREQSIHFKGKLKWDEHPLVFGSLMDHTQDWPGMIEHVAMYSRALAPEEIAAHAKFYQASLAGKKGAPIVRVRAKLVERSPQRDAKDLGAYRRDLVAYAYEVQQVVFGKLDEEEIKIYHWSILDRQPLPVTKQVGQVYDLLISPEETRPDLEGERIQDQLTNPVLPGFLDISDP